MSDIMSTSLEKLTTEELLNEYEFTVRTMHYDPMARHTPEFSEEDLRAEVKRRLAVYEKHKEV